MASHKKRPGGPTPMDQRHKAGVLSNADKNFILENIEKMSVEEIAERLDRNKEPIAKFLALQNKIALEVSPLKEDEYIRIRLLSEFFWPILRKQLSTQEQDYFVSQWAELVQQFNEDITPTEKQQIKALILNEIYKNRAGIEVKKCADDIEKYEKKIEAEEKKETPDLGKIGLYNTQIAMAKTSIQGLTIQLKDYSKTGQDLFKDLKGTRADRYKSVENNQTTFTHIIRALDSKEERDKQSREIALMTLAEEKAQENLYDLHVYIDRRARPAYFKRGVC